MFLERPYLCGMAFVFRTYHDLVDIAKLRCSPVGGCDEVDDCLAMKKAAVYSKLASRRGLMGPFAMT